MTTPLEQHANLVTTTHAGAIAGSDTSSVSVSLNLAQAGTIDHPPVVPDDKRAAVVPSDHVQVLVLPDDLEAPALARAWLADRVADLPPGVVADAVLMISELVANAVLHGRPDVKVAMRVSPPALRVAVTDLEPTMPVLPSQVLNPLQHSGRGLFIVNRLANTWGVDPHRTGTGKSVWFTLKTADDAE